MVDDPSYSRLAADETEAGQDAGSELQYIGMVVLRKNHHLMLE